MTAVGDVASLVLSEETERRVHHEESSGDQNSGPLGCTQLHPDVSRQLQRGDPGGRGRPGRRVLLPSSLLIGRAVSRATGFG